MNETKNQMSLLDAIGLSAPEETQKPKKNTSTDAETKTAKPKKKKPAKSKEKAHLAADAENIEAEAEVTDPPEAVVKQEVDGLIAATSVSSEKPQVSTADVADAPSLDKYICFALYSANHAMHGVYKTLLKEVGLTYPQFLAMTVLWETNNVPVGAITSKLQLDTNTLTPLLKRLESMGLLTRTRNIKDERQVILKLTRKGRALQKKTEHFSHCI
ncbi:MAG: MarR family transcriptional regulator, partial [Roseibium sp.]|uniref:MarR family winged helix-turn-helix transcriptional regulator n=1 Tax=Roseibium sp. TaxID=1936156 RepID=UPI00261A92E8